MKLRAYLLLWLVIAGSALAAPSPALPFDAKPESGSWLAATDDNLLEPRTVLLGDRGLALLPEVARDFTFTVRLRFDELRYQARVPASGLAFAVRDRRNLHAVVLDTGSGQLRVQRVTDGRVTTLATSATHAILPVGEWWWLRVQRAGENVSAALSRDGTTWLAPVNATLAGDATDGRLGLIADTPTTHFDLAPPPPRALRDRGEWVQSSDGTVTATLHEETFSPEHGLARRRHEVAFAPGTTTATLAGLTLANPAQIASPATAPAAPANSTRILAPTASDYLAALHRVGKIVPRDGYRLLGTALASAQHSDTALHAELRSETTRLLTVFQQSGEVPRGFAQVYAAFRALQVSRTLAPVTATDGARTTALVTRALTVGAYERGAMNRALGMAAAIAPGLALAPGHPERAALARTRELVLGDFATHAHQPLEDSTNYQLISLFFALNLALDDPSLGWENEPHFRAAFEHLVAQLSSDGSITAYGDDYASHPGMLVGLFEAAARLWREPRFRGAAALVYARHFADGRVPGGLVGEDYLGLGFAAAQADATLAVEIPWASSALVTRAADGAANKLVFASGRADEDFTLLFDLLNGTEHGHHDALALVGAVAHGRPLLPDAGRYARSGEFHNRLIVADSSADFPLRADTGEQSRRMLDPTPRRGEWRTWRLSLRHHWVWGNFAGDIGLPALERDQYHPDIPTEFHYAPATQFALLFEVKGEGRARFEIADVRLTGGKQPSRSLTEFPASFETDFSPASRYLGAVLTGPLDVKSGDHEWLEFRLRVTPAEDATAIVNSVVIGDVDGYPKRFVPPDSPTAPTVVRRWEKTPWGARAILSTDYVTRDGPPLPVTREIIYVAGRAAAIRDTITNPTPTARFVGPVWHVNEAELSSDATCTLRSSGATLRFAARPGSKTTLRRHAIVGVDSPQIFAQGAVLPPGETRTFDTLLLPPGAADATPVAVQLEAKAIRVDDQLMIPWESQL